jgi:hypothetical protein
MDGWMDGWMDGRRTKGTTAVKSDDGRQTRKKRTDRKKRYTNDHFVVLRVLGCAAVTCSLRFRDSESTTQALEAQDMGNYEAVRIRATHWAILVQGWHSAVNVIAATTNAMTDEPHRSTLIRFLLDRALGGSDGEHATRLGVLLRMQRVARVVMVRRWAKAVLLCWYLRLS